MKFFPPLIFFILIVSSYNVVEEKSIVVDGIDDAAHFRYYENESHIIHWYEWWYANLKDGEDGIIVMFFTFGNLNSFFGRAVGVFAALLNENESIESLQISPFIPFSLDYKKCNVSIGKSRFYEENGAFFVEYEGKNMHISMKMKNRGKAYGSIAPLEGWQWAGWYVALPYGEGEAWVEYKGREWHIKGNAYHDHNWGMRKLGRFKWDWGEFNANNFSIIYGIAGSREMKGGLHFINESCHIFIPYGKLKMEYEEWQRISLVKKPTKIHFYGGNGSISADFMVEMKKFYILGYGKVGKPYLLGSARGYVEINGKRMNFDSTGFYEHHGRFE